ncbi:unnamed protein product, partial [Closterium sp. NIES-54]
MHHARKYGANNASEMDGPGASDYTCQRCHHALEPGAQPTVRTQWQLSQPELEELRSQLDYLLAKGFIRPSTSPFAAPILFTLKKDGGLRMCIDYRALNRVMIKSRYPIPRADDLLDQLRGSRYFLKIDLRGGYHQIRVFADDCPKTAFPTRYGSYEYTVMPFGLTNAPSTFQLTMNGVLRDMLDKKVIVYLDDILVYSKTKEEHFKDLEEVFRRLQHNRLITKGYKCEFLKPELEFLGHVVSGDGIKIDPRKVNAIAKWNPPTNITELQSFLGFVNYVRRFVPNMAGVTKPLTDLLHEDAFFKTLHQRATTPHGRYYLKTGTNRIWVPAYQPLRELLTQEVHDSNLSGHFGIDKTLKLLQRNHYWPDMLTDVQRYVTTCPTCQAIKSSRQRPAGLLQPLEPPERTWQQVTMDFVTGLPAGASGNDSVLVVVDRLTKMAHFAPCRTTITTERTAKLFISTVVRLHGLPSAIISDRDPKFTSKLWQETWAQYGARLHFSSSYHPQTDGQTEITNQTMEQLIRTNCHDLTKWEDSLPMLEFAYNNAPSATTKQSPFYLYYGIDPVVPSSTTPDNPVPRSQQFVTELQAARDKAAEFIRKANTVAGRNADKNRRDVPFRVGQMVFLDTKNLRLPQPAKLRPRYVGPFRITHMVTPVTARLLLPDDWKIHYAFHRPPWMEGGLPFPERSGNHSDPLGGNLPWEEGRGQNLGYQPVPGAQTSQGAVQPNPGGPSDAPADQQWGDPEVPPPPYQPVPFAEPPTAANASARIEDVGVVGSVVGDELPTTCGLTDYVRMSKRCQDGKREVNYVKVRNCTDAFPDIPMRNEPCVCTPEDYEPKYSENGGQCYLSYIGTNCDSPSGAGLPQIVVDPVYCSISSARACGEADIKSIYGTCDYIRDSITGQKLSVMPAVEVIYYFDKECNPYARGAVPLPPNTFIPCDHKCGAGHILHHDDCQICPAGTYSTAGALVFNKFYQVDPKYFKTECRYKNATGMFPCEPWYADDGALEVGAYDYMNDWNPDVCASDKAYNCHNNVRSTLSLEVDLVRDGHVRFNFTVSAEMGRDGLSFFIDSLSQPAMALESYQFEPREVVFPLTAGHHTLVWLYSKDARWTKGEDIATLRFIEVDGIGFNDFACTPCEPGFYSAAGASTCLPCAPNTVSRWVATCTACRIPSLAAAHTSPPP